MCVFAFSGGINLSFTGTELNSVQHPTFVVYGRTVVPQVGSCIALGSCTGIILSIFSQQTLCHPHSARLLVCTAPSLSGGDPLDSSINYTFVMDNAPGPSNTGDLSLSFVPDPSIPTDGSALINAVFTPGNFIQIRVNLTP